MVTRFFGVVKNLIIKQTHLNYKAYHEVYHDKQQQNNLEHVVLVTDMMHLKVDDKSLWTQANLTGKQQSR